MNKREFLGRIEVFCLCENELFVYDEITKGIYCIDTVSWSVRILLSREDIFQNKDVGDRAIRGILKKGNEIVLVPQYANREWIHYNLIDGKIERISHLDYEYIVVEVACCGNLFYLIPLRHCGFVLCGKSDNFLIQKVNIPPIDLSAYSETKIFGHCIDECSNVYFPIVSSDYYLAISEDKVTPYKAPCVLRSVSAYNNRVYLLPERGECFFAVNHASEKREEIEFDGSEASDFKRVIAIPGGALFCPTTGSHLYFYNDLKGEFKKIIFEGNHLVGELLYEVNCSYWTYYLKESGVVFLPLRYRYTEMDCNSEAGYERALLFEDDRLSDYYYSIMRNDLAHRGIVNEKQEHELNDFIALL